MNHLRSNSFLVIIYSFSWNSTFLTHMKIISHQISSILLLLWILSLMYAQIYVNQTQGYFSYWGKHVTVTWWCVLARKLFYDHGAWLQNVSSFFSVHYALPHILDSDCHHLHFYIKSTFTTCNKKSHSCACHSSLQCIKTYVFN